MAMPLGVGGDVQVVCLGIGMGAEVSLRTETPFQRRGHNGACDFSSYSLSGHGRLLKRLQDTKGGTVAGSAITLAWSIEKFLLLYLSCPRICLVTEALVWLVFKWAKHFDQCLKKRPKVMHGVSCAFSLGPKRTSRVVDDEIIVRSIDAKHLSHI
jgi:hypothetical protein